MQAAYKNCPLCESSFKIIAACNITGHQLWHKALPENIEWCTCNNCHHLFTRHYWDAEGLKQVFLKSHEGQLASADMHHPRVVWAQTIERAVNHLGGYAKLNREPERPKWLDVGFGNGVLMTTAEEYGFIATGIDARKAAVSRLDKLGYDVKCTDFENMERENFRVISMCDVLEHMPYPRQALEKTKQMLDDKGVLIISMPNFTSSHWKALDAESMNPYWTEIEHYHNFSSESLTKLLNEQGFEVTDYAISPRYIACMEVYARHKAA